MKTVCAAVSACLAVSCASAFVLPELPTGTGAPQIYEYSREAGPEETLFVVGEGLDGELLVWGSHPQDPNGRKLAVKTHFKTPGYLAFTLPDSVPDGIFVAAVKNKAGWSKPFVINTPEIWWCSPRTVRPGETVRIFGRNLARRPDFRKAVAELVGADGTVHPLAVEACGKYELRCRLPETLPAGKASVRVLACSGGDYGRSELEPVVVAAPVEKKTGRYTLKASSAARLPEALEKLAAKGGGTLQLTEGTYPFTGTLRIPENVTLAGAGEGKTVLELQQSLETEFRQFGQCGWNFHPESMQTAGDSMTYTLNIPAGGKWTVWVRYGTGMAAYGKDWTNGVSGRSSLTFDDTTEHVLRNLPDTGSFSTLMWAKNGELELSAGKHKMVWRNTKGGGISLDAFVFCRNPAEVLTNQANPDPSPDRVIVQAEACDVFGSQNGRLPGGNRAAVWLCGSNAGLEDLTVLGNGQVNEGVAVKAATADTDWLSGCTIRNVRIADADGKHRENYGIHLYNLMDGTVVSNTVYGRAPLFFSGLRRVTVGGNTLYPSTRFGGNAEASILGRTEPIEECIIEDNLIASPEGTGGGGATSRRLLWFSTGRGSIQKNFIARNGVKDENKAGQPRFGGVAGHDQNVGEMILFEGCHRTMFFGAAVSADARSITLPKTVPTTPDNRLGSVKRSQLVTDAAGNETPYWPALKDDNSGEPPQDEYFVTVFKGRGQGQTRRVIGREGEKLLLEKPWQTVPGDGAVIAVGVMFHRNLIVGNTAPDGMSGVQLWISCVENIVSGNTINRMRKQGLFFFSCASTLASSMPRHWNRGIAPLFWNVAEGNRIEEASEGLIVRNGDGPGLPIEFPRSLGNVFRHNTFIRSRTIGMNFSGNGTTAPDGSFTGTSIGNVAEFNLVRDAQVGYYTSNGTDYSVLRRNHAYFWYPVTLDPHTPVAFKKERAEATVSFEHNTIEGVHGVPEKRIVEMQ